MPDIVLKPNYPYGILFNFHNVMRRYLFVFEKVTIFNHHFINVEIETQRAEVIG